MKKQLETLPRAQKNAAKYMLENPSESLFMTAQALGVMSHTSEATVIRLAATLGFPGFPEFKEALQREAKNQLSTFGRLTEHRAKHEQENGIYKNILFELNQSAPKLAEIDAASVRALASAICASESVYLIGLRSTRSLAVYMQYYLTWFLPHVYTPENDFVENYIVTAPKNSLVVGISFPRYTRLTLRSIEMANKMGIKTAAITDAASSPLAQAAKISVLVPCVHVAHIDSLMLPLAMANAILVEVANQLGGKALERLNQLEKMWDKEGVYC
ncbi:MurR/RpiR family transcriptional regulator [Synergistaceae bacterium OttesenSCG-928-D05]|nr:MurR/RpiR family transcriptional regulator [Synergistaceae bacterium OttesenSCG-928-D05]